MSKVKNLDLAWQDFENHVLDGFDESKEATQFAVNGWRKELESEGQENDGRLISIRIREPEFIDSIIDSTRAKIRENIALYWSQH